MQLAPSRNLQDHLSKPTKVEERPGDAELMAAIRPSASHWRRAPPNRRHQPTQGVAEPELDLWQVFDCQDLFLAPALRQQLGAEDACQQSAREGRCAEALASVEEDRGDGALADFAAFIGQQHLVEIVWHGGAGAVIGFAPRRLEPEPWIGGLQALGG